MDYYSKPLPTSFADSLAQVPRGRESVSTVKPQPTVQPQPKVQPQPTVQPQPKVQPHLCCGYATHIQWNLSGTVSNFTHPPALSDLLLVLPASRFVVPDCALLLLAPFLFPVPVQGMTSPFLSDRNRLQTPSSQTFRHLFSPN